jgi:hypothetical protein
MSGRLILNLEALFAVATTLLLLWRSHRKNREAIPSSRFAIDLSDGLRMASVALLSAIVFWPATRIYFLSDDFVLVNMAKTFQGWSGVGWSGLPRYSVMFTRGGGDGFYRPLGYISLFWTWPWAGLDPSRWHWVGLILHVLCVLLVYVLAGAIGLSRTGAWFASALFALHGSHPEAMLWIAGRFDVLSTVFVLAGLVAFIKLWERPSAVAGLVASLAMSLGILCKESAYAAPLMMLVYVASQPEASWKKRTQYLAPFFLLAGCLFAYRWVLQGGIGGYLTAEGKPQMFAVSLLSIGKALFLRLWAILFFPVDWAEGASAWLVIALVAYLAAWVWTAWGAQGRRVSALALGFALAAAIPPVQQLLIGADLEKARLLYLPSVGFCLLAAAALDTAAPKLRFAASIGMLAFSFAALMHNLDVWERVAGKSKTVCEAVSACSNPESVTGLPRSLDGVYFFANGLPECVVLERSRNPEAPRHACTLAWDDRAGELK